MEQEAKETERPVEQEALVLRAVQRVRSVAASREEDAKAARWAASKESKGSGEGRGEGSQPAEDHRRQNQGSDSGSEAG